MTRTTVGVLRGGPSPLFDISLKTGAHLLSSLPEEDFDVRDLYIDKAGTWHSLGREVDPQRALQQVDVVLNGLHGPFGEDGGVQRVMDRVGVAYVGSRASVSALGSHKARTQEHLAEHGIRMPRSIHLTLERALQTNTGDLAQRVFTHFGPPYVIKPAHLGASLGVTVVRSIQELPDVLADMLETYDHVLIQEFIPGVEATVGVVEQYRGNDFYALPAIEIRHGRTFLDYATKHEGGMDARCPSSFGSETKRALENLARTVHQALGASHYSRSDFIVHPSGKIYFLEINTQPDLAEHSLMPQALSVVGSSMPEFSKHLVRLGRG